MNSHISLEGAPNFRDLGGYRAANGCSVRRARVFRSDSLAKLSDADVTKITNLRISFLYDLRTSDERIRYPNLWHPEHTIAALDKLNASELDAVRFFGWRERMTDPTFDSESAHQWMLDAYAVMPRLFAGLLSSVLKQLSEPTSPVILLHCTAGKDRTGFACAMLLFALGVSRDDVVSDYLETRNRQSPENFLTKLLGDELLELPPKIKGALCALAGVSEDYLSSALSAIERDFGNVDTYLAEACHCGPDQRARLQSMLLE